MTEQAGKNITIGCRPCLHDEW